MKSISFSRLQELYGPGLLEIKDPIRAKELLGSRDPLIIPHGGRTAATGWIQLGNTGEFLCVCRKSLIKERSASVGVKVVGWQVKSNRDQLMVEKLKILTDAYGQGYRYCFVASERYHFARSLTWLKRAMKSGRHDPKTVKHGKLQLNLLSVWI